MKEPEKYKQPEEETTRLSEPTVAYNSMAYLELEANAQVPIRPEMKHRNWRCYQQNSIPLP